MKTVVKFGGSSLASAEQFKKVGEIIRKDPARRFVVPSAPGKRFDKDTKVTDMLYGVYHSRDPEKNMAALLELLSWIEILPFDLSAAECAGKLMAYLASKGTPLGDRDMLIAGHALSNYTPLVTHNTREFLRVPNLHIEDWQI